MLESPFLSKLQRLSNGLRVVPDTNSSLSYKTRLRKIIEFPEKKEIRFLENNGEIIGLNLAHVSLSEKELSRLEEFSTLKSLSLSINHTEKWEVPSFLDKLHFLSLRQSDGLKKVEINSEFPSLKFLQIEAGNLEEVYIYSKLASLEKLSLGNNRLKSLNLPSGMEALKDIYLQNNLITHIDVTGILPACESLNLQNNQLAELGPEFLKPFPLLNNLNLIGNPLPESIISNINNNPNETLAFIKRYLSDLAKGGESDLEIKIFLLGNGNVGQK